MNKKLFITGTGTDIGKTWVTAGLAQQLRQKGLKVEILKPIITGWNSKENDTKILLEAAGLEATQENIENCSPWRFKAPLSADLAAAKESIKVNFQEVVDFCERPGEGIRLIEGVGGIMSPLNDSKTFLDLAKALDCKIILVAGTYLGAITHTLTALKVLAGCEVSLAINESAQSPVTQAETAKSIFQFSKVPITLIPRVKTWQEMPDLTKI